MAAGRSGANGVSVQCLVLEGPGPGHDLASILHLPEAENIVRARTNVSKRAHVIRARVSFIQSNFILQL